MGTKPLFLITMKNLFLLQDAVPPKKQLVLLRYSKTGCEGNIVFWDCQ